MAGEKYYDLILAEDMEGVPKILKCESSRAEVGDLVVANGEVLRVMHKAWVGTKTEVFTIITSILPVEEIEEVYSHGWSKGSE